MTVASLITPDSVVAGIKGANKKQVLLDLSGQLARVSGLPEREIYETLLQRERLGTTGIGQGIAIPHGRIAGLRRLVGLFARLQKPVDFEALDGEHVDLVFVLLAPTTYRRLPASPGCSATRKRSRSCDRPRTQPRFTPFSPRTSPTALPERGRIRTQCPPPCDSPEVRSVRAMSSPETTKTR